MQDTEENRWLLLDMARAMGGYGYDHKNSCPVLRRRGSQLQDA